jgi:DNA (cytosine-5)-methyltransferase 1
MEYSNKTRKELIAICKDRRIKGYSGKKKDEVIALLAGVQENISPTRDIREINNKLTVADFFCGAGGFSEGFNQEGFEIAFALDYWKPAHITHMHNHPNCKGLCMNILDIDFNKIDEIIPDTDIIIGSPPCISFSNSNSSGKADKTLGIKLILQFLKIVLYKQTKFNSKLKFWIMENVPNSIKFVKDKYTASELGLDSSLPDLIIKNKEILCAADYGSPQGRKRAIVGDYISPICFNDKVFIDKVLENIGPPQDNTKIVIDDPFYNFSLKREELSDHFYDSELPNEWVEKARHLKIDHGYMGKMDFPDRTNRLCRTIMATESYCSRESIIFRKENSLDKFRAPTIRELACLMGFPIDYQFIGNNSNCKHRQIGNAVCVHLSAALARAIKSNYSSNIDFVKCDRQIVLCKNNLNDLKCPIFFNYKMGAKKLTAKYHVHVPYMKINQLRIELDNVMSNFENLNFVWRCVIHRGSGKNACSTVYSNSNLIPIICNHIHFNEINDFIELNKNRVFDSYKFQEKYCNTTEVNSNHYSPDELLKVISDKIMSLNIEDEYVENLELDICLNFSKKNLYSMKIMYALYILNSFVEYLVK